MSEHRLLTSQRNMLFTAIQNNGLDPASFHWEMANSFNQHNLIVPRLIHVQSDGYFQFELQNDVEWCQYSPGQTKYIEQQYPGNWNGQYSYFCCWLSYLKEEFETPDLWSVIAGDSSFEVNMKSDGNEDESNKKFNSSERKHISQNLNEIREYLVTAHSISGSSLRLIEERLKYLEDAAGRVGRKDWINLAYGALINIIVGAALAPTAAKDLLRMAGSAFAWVVGHLPQIPFPA
ncbi:hypothetical protein [Trichlorobacter lovleyi]|uniref:Uncharacterized protein n=1 Tax=Trichlorobacter lovleyi (strain ATCC BAA-1151 / DSM 17278 / SZ) TaxID=398767 RepID=B3E765_TRIL1|nr:hypothetical protein [Trichlorobacter lovleyi]ACD94945.1 hypothetical protein Glov_1223 [Trichlorobacter lovleyi SZ]